MPVDLVVVGLGYVGLPLARQACAAGLAVAGLDSSSEVVSRLSAGRSHVRDVPDRDIARMLAGGFTATGDPAVVRGADTVAVRVPTGLTADRAPDLASV